MFANGETYSPSLHLREPLKKKKDLLECISYGKRINWVNKKNIYTSWSYQREYLAHAKFLKRVNAQIFFKLKNKFF